MFKNDWTRKCTGFALIVWGFAVIVYTVARVWWAFLGEDRTLPSPAEWALFLAGVASSVAGIITVTAVKSHSDKATDAKVVIAQTGNENQVVPVVAPAPPAAGVR